ncbi:trypsin-like peptidase domain-containing protein [Streptomyces sp. SMC 277]|uniref:Trypsin-like peptidase domain-containing protein n=2 Tax=Streptomyces antimicrobicus TaxID=2883108 RepID=A0ABS8BDK3_9ACTN|nr:AAA family ATPase [Streptomyces antimicrobicus]MCB5182720.1 trypsin-like peptidase domain-containing protein [Streptomyces antimicrobicus]
MRPLGSGFLVDGRRVLTCAHVVEAIWAKQGVLWVALPKAEGHLDRRVRVAEIALPQAADHEIRDVAMLVLSEPAPAGLAAPLRRPNAEELVGTGWWSFGFPDGVLGNSADGSVGEALGYGWMRLDSGNPRYPVKGGFSGAAVWSSAHQAVVGMVGQAHSATGDARALTLWGIDRLLPEQRLHDLDAAPSPSWDGGTMSAPWAWSLGDDPEAGRHWRPRARGVSTEAERGNRFRGREAVLREIVSALGPGRTHRQVLVVTGAPGSGKSAVLSRIITTSDSATAAALPTRDTAIRAPLGSVGCAVHAKGKTALEVATEIARAAGSPPPGEVVDLLPALRAALESRPDGPPFVLVLDALDEVVSPDEARTIVHRVLVPLAETCADLQVRVVVGTRRRDGAGDLLGTFGRTARVLDLDAPVWSAPADLTAYALATLQLHGDERPGNPYADPAVALPVAARIAALAEGNFLVAGLVARTHGIHDVEAVDPVGMAFPATVDSSLREYLRLLPGVGPLAAADVLLPLVYAEDPGLTTGLWRTALRALFGTAPTEAELLGFARTSAANFLVEASADGSENASFRLFHQALSDSLRTTRADLASVTADQRALAHAFIAEGARVGWAAAPAYLLRSLAVHAARAGAIDRLLAEDDYPLHADLRRLVPEARRAGTEHGRERAKLLRQTPRAIDVPAAERVALYSMTEVQEGLGTTYRDHPLATPYRAVWSTASPSVEISVFEGHTEKVHALCAFRSDGRPRLASVADDGIRIWDPQTGPVGHVPPHPSGWVQALCPVPTGGGTELLAAGGLDGAVRLWNPETGELVRTLEGHRHPVGDLCILKIDHRACLVSHGTDRRVNVWDPHDGRLVRTFRPRCDSLSAVCPLTLDGRTLLAVLVTLADGRSRIRLWDPATGESLRSFAVSGASDGALAAVSAAGATLLAVRESSERDHLVALWDARTGRRVGTLEGGEGTAYELLGVRVAGRDLVVAGYGQEESGTVMVWDPQSRRVTHRLEGHHGWVGALAVVATADETLIASSGEDCTVRLWDLDGPAEPAEGDRRAGSWVGSLTALDVDGRPAVAGSGTAGWVSVHDVATGAVIGRVHTPHAHVDAVCSASIGGEAALAVASRSTAESTVQIWSPATGDGLRTRRKGRVVDLCALEVHGRPCLGIASRDEKGNRVDLWDLSGDEVVASMLSGEGLVNSLCTMEGADGRHLVSVHTGHFGLWPGEFQGGIVTAWDPLTGTVDETGVIAGAALGRHTAVVLDDRILLAMTAHRQDHQEDRLGSGWVHFLDPPAERAPDPLEVSVGWLSMAEPFQLRDQVLLATAAQTERVVRLWDLAERRLVMEIPVRREVFSVVQAGDHLVVGLNDGALLAVRVGNPS